MIAEHTIGSGAGNTWARNYRQTALCARVWAFFKSTCCQAYRHKTTWPMMPEKAKIMAEQRNDTTTVRCGIDWMDKKDSWAKIMGIVIVANKRLPQAKRQKKDTCKRIFYSSSAR